MDGRGAVGGDVARPPRGLDALARAPHGCEVAPITESGLTGGQAYRMLSGEVSGGDPAGVRPRPGPRQPSRRSSAPGPESPHRVPRGRPPVYRGAGGRPSGRPRRGESPSNPTADTRGPAGKVRRNSTPPPPAAAGPRSDARPTTAGRRLPSPRFTPPRSNGHATRARTPATCGSGPARGTGGP